MTIDDALVVLGAGLTLLTMLIPAGTAGPEAAIDPVANGGFELYAETIPGVTSLDGREADGALFWDHSGIRPESADFRDIDDDLDREAVLGCLVDWCSFVNMGQSITSATQVFSADFEAYAFTIEAGVVPSDALVFHRIWMWPACADDAYPYPCTIGLSWSNASMVPDDQGRVTLDPVDATFSCLGGGADGQAGTLFHDPRCDRFEEEWAAADDEARREMIRPGRVVEHSFQGFHLGEHPVVIDDVSIEGAQPAPLA